MSERVSTVVVGGGPAGLAASEHLARAGHDHVVLERGRVGDTWRTQRWDGFLLNTPGWMSGLDDADGFGTAADLVESLEGRAAFLPVQEGVEVGGVWRRRGGGYLVAAGDTVYECEHVVAASGAQRVPYLPSVSDAVTGLDIEHLHVADYRRPGDLPGGAVLVVGAGQSGGQIAMELLRAGRRVLLATSTVPRMPRRYRGRDVMEWGSELGTLLQPADEVAPSLRGLPQLLIAGGESLSLQSLARSGGELLGRLSAADGSRLWFSGDPVEHAAFADAMWAKQRARIDDHIARHGSDAPDGEDDIAPLTSAEAPGRSWLDLHEEEVTSVIWASGFRGDFGWLKMPILDERGRPLHRGVATHSPGLFTIGVPWQTTRMSAALWGIRHDAELVAQAITGVPAQRIAQAA